MLACRGFYMPPSPPILPLALQSVARSRLVEIAVAGACHTSSSVILPSKESQTAFGEHLQPFDLSPEVPKGLELTVNPK
jgi:hypothetical protein